VECYCASSPPPHLIIPWAHAWPRIPQVRFGHCFCSPCLGCSQHYWIFWILGEFIITVLAYNSTYLFWYPHSGSLRLGKHLMRVSDWFV
jgi:hypothetical protein